ncbi:exo-beta-N-acetylmuramidase NamZ domain-containing protein [Cesiribacter sp. SM1]|uniref:exo-beta-N-acetylmuramidase NamZ family protein n=1 Tax=Cesiribacter sp. SM1 TaxID=2861196 RepID=UPI001CD1A856|nr:DUF1343 domain-containing protein [Cesiribacter sp. SM1]
MMQQIELFGKFCKFFLQQGLLLSLLLPATALASCQNSTSTQTPTTAATADAAKETVPVAEPQALTAASLRLGAERVDFYLPMLKGKRIGMIVNHTSLVPQQNGEAIHLVDLLLKEGVQVKKVFAPEHGFRGTADAGEKVASTTDPTTGLPVVSLYGNNKKPTPEQLQDIDLLLFDIQDVGARFYTYISTMHYAMEAAAEQGKEIMVLDRPNPLGHIIDGPVLNPKFRSFVGMHTIPVIHGLTVAELAQMINGEGWLAGQKQAKLTVVPMEQYTHNTPYVLPVRPSPNLPNQQSILLYPSLCFFEGTPISLGRGTPFPFQVIGYPDHRFGSFTFTPTPMPGAKNPPLEGKQCWGLDLREVTPPNELDLGYVISFYQLFPEKEQFFKTFFNTLAGTDQLAAQIKQGLTEEQIRASWQPELESYKSKRTRYLLYPDAQ